ncbi:hypothetical protein DAEQUDRAFT_665441, partial [Daedalea quercina L-15889]
YPDISPDGLDFNVVVNGEIVGASGTRYLTPTFASIIALHIDQLLAAGKSTLSWLSSWPYSTVASALNGVMEGNKIACSTSTAGLNAAAGWDPVSSALTR